MPIISGGGSGGLPGVTVSGAAAASKVLVATSSSAASWAFPPGFEIGYDQITATVNPTGTTEGTATTIITCAAHTFDGGLVLATFNAPLAVGPGAAAGNNLFIGLFESGTLVNRLAASITPAANTLGVWISQATRFTPSAGSHTYTIGAWVTNTTGTPSINAGAGGAGASSPAFVRFTKV